MEVMKVRLIQITGKNSSIAFRKKRHG